MTIQQINLGSAPSGAGGDTQRAANTKINQNFTNTTHAASRLVGSANGQIPLAEQAFKAANSLAANPDAYGKDTFDCDTFEVGSKYLVNKSNKNAPPSSGIYNGDTYVVSTHASYVGNRRYQMAVSYAATRTTVYYRSTNEEVKYTGWVLASQSPLVYSTTTATAANMVVDSNGGYARASSSLKYKDVLFNLELDDEDYKNAMQVKPIVYRSKSEIDPQSWHFLSFAAEELSELEPALVQWRTHEEDPETGEQVELEQKEAEGINLNAICAVLHATNIKQDEMIKALEARIEALEGE